MARRTRLLSAVLLLLASPGVSSSERSSISPDNYALLVADVYNYYKASCVMFVRSGSYNDLSVVGLMHSWLLEFSHRSIFSMATTFHELPIEMAKYYSRIARPLFVVLLDTKESMDEFAAATLKLRISFPLWLTIFAQHPGNPLKGFCQEPKGNPFNLAFDTEMLIQCYEHSILMEWYALRDNHTRVANIANWSPKNGFQPLVKKSLYARRDDMFGEILRIATVENSPFVTSINGTLTGFFGGIVTELSAVMNFTMQPLIPDEDYGGWNDEKKVWTGVIGQVSTGQADLGVAEFTVTTARLKAVDFTIPMVLTNNRVYLKEPSGLSVEWSQYFKAFDAGTWAAITGLLTAAPILLTVIRTRGRFVAWVMVESYMHVWGIYCQQGLTEFPNESSLRLAFFSIFISALIVWSAYSAALISFLTVATGTLPFNTMEGFADDGTYNLIVVRNTADYDFFANAQDTLFLRIKALMRREDELPLALSLGFGQVCFERVGFYTVEAFKDTLSVYLPCQVAYVETGKVESLAMTLTKGNPYTGLMNYHLQRFRDQGILSRLRASRAFSPVPVETKHDAVTIWGIAPILAILAGGLILACLIFAVERIHALGFNWIEPWSFSKKTIGAIHKSRLPGAGLSVSGQILMNPDKLVARSDYETPRFIYRP